MIFKIFRDFSDFIFYLKMSTINKKIAKSARVPRGCDVACKVTWQSPRRAYVVHYTYSIYFIIIYIIGLQPSLYGKGY